MIGGLCECIFVSFFFDYIFWVNYISLVILNRKDSEEVRQGYIDSSAEGKSQGVPGGEMPLTGNVPGQPNRRRMC